MKKYEITYLLAPELDETEITKKESLIGGVLQKKTEKITLTYPIQKKNEAFFGCQEIKTEPAKIKEIEKNLKKEKDILRFLIIKKTAPKEIKETIKKPNQQTKEIKEKTADIDQELEKILNE